MKVCVGGDAFTGEIGNKREYNLGSREGVVKDDREKRMCGAFKKLQKV